MGVKLEIVQYNSLGHVAVTHEATATSPKMDSIVKALRPMSAMFRMGDLANLGKEPVHVKDKSGRLLYSITIKEFGF